MPTPDIQEPSFISIIDVLKEEESQSLAMGPIASQDCSAHLLDFLFVEVFFLERIAIAKTIIQ